MRTSVSRTTIAALSKTLLAFGLFGHFHGWAKETSGPREAAPVISLQLHVPTPVGGGEKASLLLHGRDARQQLLVTGSLGTGGLCDLTHQASFESAPSGVVQIDRKGMVTPLADGTAVITAKSAEGLAATLPVQVERFDEVTPVNFANQIVPFFTKTGCNAGACH